MDKFLEELANHVVFMTVITMSGVGLYVIAEWVYNYIIQL